MSPRPAIAGFTLIELSVVIVIIGLVVGGILAGHELIRNAEIRKTVKQFEEFDAAVNTFKTKYACLPGDCPNAQQIGLDPASWGDGNERIGPTLEFLAGAGEQEWWEPGNFWYHLGESLLIRQKFVSPASQGGIGAAGRGSPQVEIKSLAPNFSPQNCGWIVIPNMAFLANAGGDSFPGHSFVLHWRLLYNDLPVVRCGYRPMDIYEIDKKIDNGNPVSGKARGWNRMQNPPGIGIRFDTRTGSCGPTSNACGCPAGVPTQYNIRYAGTAINGLCSIAIGASF